MKQYSLSPIRSSLSFKYDRKKKLSFLNKNPMPKKIPKITWSNLNIDDNCFNSLFWGMLHNYYKLPVIENKKNNEFLSNSLTIKLLYYYDNIVTVQVKWNIEPLSEYFAILSLEKINGMFKVVGFNQPTSVRRTLYGIYDRKRSKSKIE